jgi:hypothetical protein
MRAIAIAVAAAAFQAFERIRNVDQFFSPVEGPFVDFVEKVDLSGVRADIRAVIAASIPRPAAPCPLEVYLCICRPNRAILRTPNFYSVICSIELLH